MEDKLLTQARAQGLADERGLYIACNAVKDGRPLGRVWAFLKGTRLHFCELEFPAGLGRTLAAAELAGARAEITRFLVPTGMILDTAQGRYELRGFRGEKAFLAAVTEAAQAHS